jgi:hypothetical protein
MARWWVRSEAEGRRRRLKEEVDEDRREGCNKWS